MAINWQTTLAALRDLSHSGRLNSADRATCAALISSLAAVGAEYAATCRELPVDGVPPLLAVVIRRQDEARNAAWDADYPPLRARLLAAAFRAMDELDYQLERPDNPPDSFPHTPEELQTCDGLLSGWCDQLLSHENAESNVYVNRTLRELYRQWRQMRGGPPGFRNPKVEGVETISSAQPQLIAEIQAAIDAGDDFLTEVAA